MSIHSNASFGDVPATAASVSSNPLDAWLDRVTRPLSVDRELQLEVRQELHSHVDESIANLRTAGRSDEQARQEAIAALGDENDLSQQLWRANRRRMRVRALAAWMVRLVLPAATVALIIFLGFSAFVSYGLASNLLYRMGLDDWYRTRTFGTLPPDVKGLIDAGHGLVEDRFTIARRLVEQYPNDRALYANYALAATRREVLTNVPGPVDASWIAKPNEPLLSETLAILAEGERREPDNAFYPLKAASYLFDTSVTQIWDDPALTIERPDATGKDREQTWSSITVTDPARYAQAMELFRRGVAKPYLQDYTDELLRRKLAALPRPRQLSELSLQAMEAMNTPWPDYAGSVMYFAAYAATEEARAGRIEVARDLTKMIRRGVALMLAGMEREQHVRYALHLERVGDEADARIALTAGDKAAAVEAWKRFDADGRDQRAARTEETRRKGQENMQYPWRNYVSGYADLTPVLRAQSASLTALGVSMLATSGLFVALVYALAALPAWLFSPRDAKPPRLFIGWRRLAGVIALGVITPMLVMYVGLWMWSKFSSTVEVVPNIEGILLRYGLLALVIPILTHILLRRAIRARTAELGATLPTGAPMRSRLAILVLIVAALITVAVLISPAMSVFTFENKALQSAIQAVLIAGSWIGLMIVIARLVVSARKRGWPASIPLAGTLPRSAFPAAVVVALVLAMIGLPSRWTERRAVDQAMGASVLLTRDEMSRSPFEPLREKVLLREGIALRAEK